MRPKATDLERERKEIAGNIRSMDFNDVVGMLMKTGQSKVTAEFYLKKFMKSKGMKESTFEAYINASYPI